MFYMGGTVSKGPIAAPDSNESNHRRELLFMLTDSSSRGKHGKLYTHENLQDTPV